MIYGYKDKHSKKLIVVNERGQFIDPKTKLSYPKEYINSQYWKTITNKKEFDTLLNNYLNINKTMSTKAALCIDNGNGKFRYLTPKKEYTIEGEEDNYLVVINDRNESSRYHKKYFKLVESKKVQEVKQDEYEIVYYHEYIQFRVNDELSDIIRVIEIDTIKHETSVSSCSIDQYDGLNNFMVEVVDFLDEIIKQHEIKDEKIKNLLSKQMTKALNSFFDDLSNENNMTIFSTNISSNKSLSNLKSKYDIDMVEILSKKRGDDTFVKEYKNRNTSNTVMTVIYFNK